MGQNRPRLSMGIVFSDARAEIYQHAERETAGDRVHDDRAATWSPNTVTYSGNNRTHMVRIPDTGRFEFRLMDGATNPYLSQAALLAAGLDGIANKRDPGKRLDIDMYEEGHTVKNVKRLPLNLLDALRLLDKNKTLRDGLGDELVDSYLKLKMGEWNAFMSHASTWEREMTLDC